MQANNQKIPEGWSVKKLSDLCSKISDGIHTTPKYVDKSEYHFINGNNLIDGHIVITPATKKVSADTYKQHFIEISSNAILISINGTLGKLAYYNDEKVMLGSWEDGKEGVILHFAPKKYRNSKPAKACCFLFCVIE